jgi:site-specific DNA-methyltransferase (adenine-specific)
LLEANSIDSCVTDPPYHLTSIVKRFGKENSAPINNRDEQEGRQGPYHRASKGFMGKQWDGGDIAFRPEVWAEVLRVLKPGAHLLAFSGTRTYHRMACAIEDAGFEIRDQIGWCYGSGFPKSHDISKGIDRIEGVEDQRVITHYKGQGPRSMFDGGKPRPASLWQGWGTALKPAWEPIVLARKPLSESSIAANVLKHGTGGINVDGCRVESTELVQSSAGKGAPFGPGAYPIGEGRQYQNSGRWPANLIHDGSEEVLAGFPETQNGGQNETSVKGRGMFLAGSQDGSTSFAGDSGSAARFFYTAKADADDRLGSKHPTVKPIDLMQYLVRLVTPKGGMVLDPFAGTGSLGEATFYEGMRAVLIEREPEYQADIVKRMGLCLSGPDQRRAASTKQEAVENLPLFRA